jgi:hypothetical protein
MGSPLPFTSKGINNTFIHELISYQQGYIILNNTFKKEKELNRGFSLFNFSLILKGAFKILLSN